MTDTTTERTSRELDLGHPVGSFVVVLIAIAAALLVLQLSGAVMPVVTNFQGQGGGGDIAGRAHWGVVLRNDGLLPVRVESLNWPTTKATEVRVDVLPRGVDVPGPAFPPPAGAATPFTLDRGEKRVVVVSGETACPALMAGELRMVVQTALGIDRRVVVEGTDSLDFGPCP